MNILNEMAEGFKSVRTGEKEDIVRGICKSWFILREDGFSDNTDFRSVGADLAENLGEIVEGLNGFHGMNL